MLFNHFGAVDMEKSNPKWWLFEVNWVEIDRQQQLKGTETNFFLSNVTISSVWTWQICGRKIENSLVTSSKVLFQQRNREITHSHQLSSHEYFKCKELNEEKYRHIAFDECPRWNYGLWSRWRVYVCVCVLYTANVLRFFPFSSFPSFHRSQLH